MVHRRDVIKAAVAASTLIPLRGAARTRPRRRADKPNLIHICADDMRFDDYKVMPNLRRLLRSHSVRFENHVLPFPLCAPSRASILTGLQAHNHGVLGNKNWGYGVYQTLEKNALPVWLSNAGYYVGHVGKFMNRYGDIAPKHIPPGYAEWHAVASERTEYWNFLLNDNGVLMRYKDGEYATDVFAAKALTFLSSAPQPYALFFWPIAPHYPATPDEQDKDAFAHVKMPAYPDFNEQDVSDKPAFIQSLPLLTAEQIATIQHQWRRRAECLQALDRALAAIVSALEQSGQIANTHIVFTSDNGYLLGEHRVYEQKDLLYEESVKVPLYWRAPGGVPAACKSPVSNIDATAALVDLAGATAGRVLDGTSLTPLLANPSAPWNTATLLQCTTSLGVATRYYRYMEWPDSNEFELYDMTADPYQLQNVAGEPAYEKIQADLAKALAALKGCAGNTCAFTKHFPKPPH